jgi:predicted TIM-barrel fold metal-dependent hydrolase
MILDSHVHYTLTRRRRDPTIERFSFEPACAAAADRRFDAPVRADDYDSCIAPRAIRRWAWRIMRALLRVDPTLPPGDDLDAELERVYATHMLADGPVERCLLLAFDAYHTRDGVCPTFPEFEFDRGGDIYTSNSLVRALCRKHPERFLFGASIHPYRPNAAHAIDELADGGASLLKWIPLHQNIDCRDERTLAVLRRCAARGLPVLVHYSEEFTLATTHPEYRPLADFLDVLRMLRAEGAMPPAIIAHLATPVMPLGEMRSHRLLLDAMRGDMADAPLYADISAMTATMKLRFLRSIADAQDLHHRLLFGSDFPVPHSMPGLRWMLPGRTYRALAREPSWVQRACGVFRAIGFNEIVFHRAAEVLPNVGYFSGTANGRPAGQSAPVWSDGLDRR